jgi:hypothetical protein
MPFARYQCASVSGEDTIEEIVRKKKMEDERKQKATAALHKSQTVTEKPLVTKGPATITSRKAAATLSAQTIIYGARTESLDHRKQGKNAIFFSVGGRRLYHQPIRLQCDTPPLSPLQGRQWDT